MTNSLNLYYIFYEAARCGNISAAARTLYISQPAVSKAIHKLEENLSAPLLLRSTRGVRLTEAGELLYRQLDTAFRAISAGEEQLRANEKLGIGSLSIGVSTTLCKYVLLPHLQDFIRDNPHVKVSLSCQSTFETIAGLTDGSLDIGLVGESERMAGLEFRPLREISDVFVATQSYLDHLASRVSYETGLECPGRDELFAHATLLLLDKKNITRQYVDRYLFRQDITMGQQLEVTTMDLLIDFARIGLGIACVIREFVKKELEEGSLVCFTLPQPFPPRQIGLAYGRNYSHNAAAQKFLNLMSMSAEESSRLL